MGETVGARVAGQGGARHSAAGRARRPRWSPTAAVIVVAAALALALRAYELARPGFLLGVT
ncbi:MAG: hypothetical protein J2P32_02235, partial [Actinobacteria bacterium]|nr:hypothetical protein [Actinomycetota bacterium]